MSDGMKKILVSVGTALLIVIAIVIMNVTTGGAVFRSGVRLGYVGNELPHSWTGKYTSIMGNFSKSITPKGDVLTIEITTNSGELNVEITNEDKEVIYSNTFTDTQTVEVPVTGKVKIKLSTDKHSGSFSFK